MERGTCFFRTCSSVSQIDFMPPPQVSAQALYNEAEKHKTWESLETCLMNLLTNGQVLDYEHNGDHVLVTLDGTTRPVKLLVNPNAPKPQPKPEATTVAAEAFEPAPEPKGGVATKARPKAALKPSRAAVAPTGAPVGVVALVGLRTETYEVHVRRLVEHVMRRTLGVSKVDAAVESSLLDWFQSLK